MINNDDVEKKLADHEIDCFVSLEESIWSEQGISSVTTIGKSGIYFAINKERSDIKTELDYAMRQLEQDSPFFKADLYKKYFTLDYNQSLTGGEKSWLEEHGDIRTPMNVILGYAQLMENELNGKDMPETLEHLEKLQQSGSLCLQYLTRRQRKRTLKSMKQEVKSLKAGISFWQKTMI